MFAFPTTHPESLTLAIDVGSGSVGLALVHHTDDQEDNVVLWSHREYVRINATIGQPTINVIKTALLNALLEFDLSGRRAIPEHLSSRDITVTQVLLNAPWVFTVSKTVSYSQENSFAVTDELITELVDAAKQETEEATKGLPDFTELAIIQAEPMAVVANGYQIDTWEKVTARTLRIDLVTSLTHISLLEVIRDLHEKMLTSSTLRLYAHTTAVYSCLRALHPEITETCIVNITSEATEIAIVRNGTLQHVTSIPQGTYTLARAFAEKSGIPFEESYSYFKGSYNTLITNSAAKEIIASYETSLAACMKNTGDALTIPRTLYVHIDQALHTTFLESVTKAAKASTGLEHAAHYLTGEILGGTQQTTDTAMQVAALFSTLQSKI